jgi:predicted PurR-regulated permease PerM
VVVNFVDIDGIVDNHCLNFLFIIVIIYFFTKKKQKIKCSLNKCFCFYREVIQHCT